MKLVWWEWILYPASLAGWLALGVYGLFGEGIWSSISGWTFSILLIFMLAG